MRILFVICVELLCGCDDFSFKVVVGVPPEITDVKVDGRDVVPDHTGLLSIERSYSDYASARSTPPIHFEFFRGDVVDGDGLAQPGLCANHSIGGCPSATEVSDESISIGSYQSFSVNDFHCLTCLGGGKSCTICN